MADSSNDTLKTMIRRLVDKMAGPEGAVITVAGKMQQQASSAPPQLPPADHAAPVDTWEVLSALKPGDPVYVRGWDIAGKAIAIDKKRKRVQVELGRMRMEADADDIFMVKSGEEEG